MLSQWIKLNKVSGFRDFKLIQTAFTSFILLCPIRRHGRQRLWQPANGGRGASCGQSVTSRKYNPFWRASVISSCIEPGLCRTGLQFSEHSESLLDVWIPVESDSNVCAAFQNDTKIVNSQHEVEFYQKESFQVFCAFFVFSFVTF